jgi:hypothetical protein
MTRFLKALVLTGQGPDRVTIFTDLPSPFAAAYPNEGLTLSFEADAGTGARYARVNFGLDAEVISRSVIPPSGKYEKSQ